jgi:hypothetical protein
MGLLLLLMQSCISLHVPWVFADLVILPSIVQLLLFYAKMLITAYIYIYNGLVLVDSPNYMGLRGIFLTFP